MHTQTQGHPHPRTHALSHGHKPDKHTASYTDTVQCQQGNLLFHDGASLVPLHGNISWFPGDLGPGSLLCATEDSP